MIVESNLAKKFIDEYKKFLLSIYVPNEKNVQPQKTIGKLILARNRFISNRGLFDEYMNNLKHESDSIDYQIMDAIKNIEVSKWVYLRDTKSYSVFIEANGRFGYGVLGLTDKISDIIGNTGVLFEAGVVKIGNNFICDGLIASIIHLGKNYIESYNDIYKELRKNRKFQTK